MVQVAGENRYRDVQLAPRGLRTILKAGEITRLLQQVAEIRQVEDMATAQRAALAEGLRARGASWDTIGWVFSTTGSAARQRYGPRHG